MMARFVASPDYRPRLMWWTAFWVFLLDQASKWLVVHRFDLMTRQSIDVLPPYLNFRMAWNRGVNFGLFADFDMRWVLIGVAVVISLVVIAWKRRDGGSRLSHVAAGLLIGGAMGNVVDRLLYGAVADFLNMSCCGIEKPYAFNVADIAVFVGAIGLVLLGGEKQDGSGPRDRQSKKDHMTAPSAQAKTMLTTSGRSLMQARLVLVPLVLVALSACGAGGDGLRNLDTELTGPDEFSVLPSQPLVMPDTNALPPPTPGGSNLTDQNPQGDAVAALGGDPAALRAGGIPTRDAALVAYAGREGVDPAIRQSLAEEDAAFRARAAGGLSLNLLGNDQYYPAYARWVLDAYEELERLRAAGVSVPSAPPLP